MNTKAYKHIEKAYMYTTNAKKAELGFGSEIVCWIGSDGQMRRLSIEDAKAFLHSARGSIEHPEQRNVPAFLLLCSSFFENKSLKFKNSLISDVNRALKASMLISGMVSESTYRNHNPTHTPVDTFIHHDGTPYKYTLLLRNLIEIVDLNTRPYHGEKLDEQSAKEIALELEHELFMLLQSITLDELNQITADERHRLKLRSEAIFRGCSKEYFQAKDTHRRATDSARETNQAVSKRQRRALDDNQDDN